MCTYEKELTFSLFLSTLLGINWFLPISSALSIFRYSDFYIVNVILLKEDFHRLQMGTFRKSWNSKKERKLTSMIHYSREKTRIDFAILLYALKIIYNGFYAKSIFSDNAKMIFLNNEDGGETEKERNFILKHEIFITFILTPFFDNFFTYFITL